MTEKNLNIKEIVKSGSFTDLKRKLEQHKIDDMTKNELLNIASQSGFLLITVCEQSRVELYIDNQFFIRLCDK